jgi:preprotein translocase subunit SecY
MTSELGRRVGFTIGALLVYRLGTFIPIPGIDAGAWTDLFRSQPGGLFTAATDFPGGGVRRMAVFALSVAPYLTAAILIQLVSMAMPPLRALTRQGELGRRRLANYTIGLTIVLAVFQSLGVASGLEAAAQIVTDPGPMFRLTTVVTLTGGTVFLTWLCGQITRRGIGNGVALILFLGIVLELPSAIAGTLELGRRGALSTDLILGVAVLAVALTGFIVWMERAQRRLLISYPSHQVGTRLIEGTAHLPIKLNCAGVIPSLLASWLLLLLVFISNLASRFGLPLETIGNALGRSRPLYLIVYALAVFLCEFFYAAFLLDPEDVAEDLRKHGGVIAGVEPGEATAEHVDYVLSRTTMLGAAYLAFVCLIPEILTTYTELPFFFGGTSLLLVVCAVLDIEAQVRGDALGKLGGAHQ